MFCGWHAVGVLSSNLWRKDKETSSVPLSGAFTSKSNVVGDEVFSSSLGGGSFDLIRYEQSVLYCNMGWCCTLWLYYNRSLSILSLDLEKLIQDYVAILYGKRDHNVMSWNDLMCNIVIALSLWRKCWSAGVLFNYTLTEHSCKVFIETYSQSTVVSYACIMYDIGLSCVN